MSKKLFTIEEIKELTDNPYVKSVSRRSLVMMPEFKSFAIGELLKGKTIRQIFADVGIDPEIIGEARIRGYSERIWKQSDREEGFRDQRADNRRREAKSPEAQAAKKIKMLEHRVAYLQQENEFLKKIQQLEEECDGKAGKRN